MVSQVDRRGLRDWLVQRISAVLIGAYTIFILWFLIAHSPLYYAEWRALFDNIWMRVATFVVLISILWHAWIGIWTVFTDYVKPKGIRLLLEVVVILLLVGYFAWVLEILF